MSEKIKQRRSIFTWICAVVMAIIFLVVPVPRYVEFPGAAQNVAQYVHVDSHKKHLHGSLMLVYVSMLRATPMTYTLSYLSPFTERETSQSVLAGNNNAQFNRVQQYYMSDAVNEAKYVSLRLAHLPVRQRYIGIYVMQVMKQSKFNGKLRVGDTVTAVNGHHYSNATAFQRALGDQRVGQRVTITYLRNGKKHQATGPVIKLPGTSRTGLGIELANRSTVQTPIKIKADMGRIGGPSAGMMLTLEMYQQLTGKDLTRGRRIAGTGTISASGAVGDIGGVDKKVVAASRAGAQIFFVPDNPTPAVVKRLDPHVQNNYQEARAMARKIRTPMKIVPVRNVRDAIRYLDHH